jgi:hypothetical protein
MRRHEANSADVSNAARLYVAASSFRRKILGRGKHAVTITLLKPKVLKWISQLNSHILHSYTPSTPKRHRPHSTHTHTHAHAHTRTVCQHWMITLPRVFTNIYSTKHFIFFSTAAASYNGFLRKHSSNFWADIRNGTQPRYRAQSLNEDSTAHRSVSRQWNTSRVTAGTGKYRAFSATIT